MKKIIALCGFLTAFLLCSVGAFAAETGKVDAVTAAGTKTSVDVSGTVTTDDVFAAVVQIRDKDDNIITMESTAVVNKAFSITLSGLSLTAESEYDVYAANYEGGDWKVTSFTVPKDQDPDPGNNPDPGKNPDPGNNPNPGNNPTPNGPGNDPSPNGSGNNGNIGGNTGNNSGNTGNAGGNIATSSRNNGKAVTTSETSVELDAGTEVEEEELDKKDIEKETSETVVEDGGEDSEKSSSIEEKETEVSTSGSVTINAKDKSKGNGLIIVLTSVGGAAILGAALYFYLLKKRESK